MVREIWIVALAAGLTFWLARPVQAQLVATGSEEIGNAAAETIESAATRLVLNSTSGEGALGTEEGSSSLLDGVAEALLGEELPDGGRLYLNLKGKDQISGAEQSMALTVGTAELTGAFLLRNTTAAGEALATQGANLPAGGSLLGANGQPIARALTNTKPVRIPTTRMGRWGTKLLRRLGPAGRLVATVANLSKLRGMARGGRPLRARLGSLGRFSTRQILYAHGTYNVLVGTTGRQIDVGVEFVEEDAPNAPTGGPLDDAEAVSESVESLCPGGPGSECATANEGGA